MAPSSVNLYNLCMNGSFKSALITKRVRKYMKSVFEYSNVDDYTLDVLPSIKEKIPLDSFGNKYDILVCEEDQVEYVVYLMHLCKYIFVKDQKEALPLRPYECLGDTFEGYLYINHFHSITFDNPKLTVWEQTYVRDKAYRFYQRYLELLKLMEAKCIVEIGSCRTEMKHALDEVNPMCCNDSHSTFFWCTTDAVVYSIDNNPLCERILTQARESGHLQVNGRLKIYIEDGIKFLRSHKFKQEIDFLFLDAWDVSTDPNDDDYAQKHLNAYQIVRPKLKETCLVAIDDTDIAHGGKGKLVIPEMLDHGFIILMKGRQTLLYRGDVGLLRELHQDSTAEEDQSSEQQCQC